MSQRPRVVLVEDSPLNLELATDILELAGFEVLQATSAERGITLAQQQAPALVLIDIRLPGMDGYAAVRALKADPATRGIPTIALTAQAMKGDDALAREAGFDGYLAKPIDTRTFARSVADFIAAGTS
jgi:two-component system cell cycle response regulator DivK